MDKENPRPRGGGAGDDLIDRTDNLVEQNTTRSAPKAQCAVSLRPYQERGVIDIREAFAAGRRRVLYTGPTGAGKTVLFTYVITNAIGRNRRVVVGVHRDELVGQVAAALESAGVLYGIIASGYPTRPLAPVQIASIPTLAQRLDRYAGAFDFLVVDEAHHAVAPSWQKVINRLGCKTLGVTATPARADGRGLGSLFDELIIGPSVAELIRAGYLADFRVYLPAKDIDLSRIRKRAGDFALDELAAVMAGERLTDDAIADYLRLCPGVPAVAFCVDVAHSVAVARRFSARGVRAAHLDGTTDREERRRIIQAFGAGALDVLCNCGLVSEGVDIPSIGAAILLRPTQSLTLYLQQVGRALRPAPGKDHALILDHAGNVLRHGLPDEPRAWSLEGTRKPARDRSPEFIRCRRCGALNSVRTAICSGCGAELRQRQPSPAAISEARRLELAAISYAATLEWAGNSVSRLKMVAAARGYKPGWVWVRVSELRARRKGAVA